MTSWHTSSNAADSSGGRLPEDSHSARALVNAARDGDLVTLARLLDEQRWPPSILSRLGFTSGYTALGLACNRGHFQIAELLLQRSADPDMAICENGVSPVMIAVVWNHTPILELLLKQGAISGEVPVGARVAGQYQGASPLDVARQRGRMEAVAHLTSARARRRFRRLSCALFSAGRFLIALQELYAEIHFRPGGEGECTAAKEFYASAARQVVVAET